MQVLRRNIFRSCFADFKHLQANSLWFSHAGSYLACECIYLIKFCILSILSILLPKAPWEYIMLLHRDWNKFLVLEYHQLLHALKGVRSRHKIWCPVSTWTYLFQGCAWRCSQEKPVFSRSYLIKTERRWSGWYGLGGQSHQTRNLTPVLSAFMISLQNKVNK